ncbi:MAG TPA: FAD-binding protein [Nevskiaceae bacterium]|nr:FAD-binding protein [Nevskiaceae bacterium]
MTDWQSECDVLVAGSGAGGVTGAYTAAREGLGVMLVEATDKFGGTTAYSPGGGMWFPCNPVLQRAGVDDTIDDALEYYHAVVGSRTPRALQDTYVRGGAPLIEYLEQDPCFGFDPYPWPDYFGKAPKARLDGQRHMVARPLPVAEAPELRELVRGPLEVDRLGAAVPDDLFIGGRALVARALKAMRRFPNASLRLEQPLVELIQEGGRVVGAIVEHDGQRCAIRARRGVLLSAGGFEHNDELRRKYHVPGSSRDAMGPPGNRGRALLAGMVAGAATDLLDQAWWSPGLTHPDGRSAFALGFTSGIFVDGRGQRFVDESAPYDRLGRAILAHLGDGVAPLRYWMIYDDSHGLVPPVQYPNIPLAPTQQYVEAGLWRSAGTLAELAVKIGVPAANLLATVARFNELAARGVDSDFGRGDEAYDRFFSDGRAPLVAIEHAPFHAAAFGVSDLGTKGGLVTNSSGNVLDTQGHPIQGLYAAGNSMAAPSGTAYPGGGNPIGTSMLFAHLSVRHMLEQRA